MSLETIAEGVETLEQAQLLASLKCHVAQGYYYGRPMSENALIEMLGTTVNA